MTSSKSSQQRFSTFLSLPKTATPPLDELLEAVHRREAAEAAADADADEASVASDTEPVPAMSTTTTTSPVARRRTRLQRLSSYLPSIITQAESKFLQDIGKDAEKPASIPRKPAPARYRVKSQSIPPSTQPSSLPPSTSTPQIAELNGPTKLQKAERPPSRAAPVPPPHTDVDSPLPAVPTKLQKESPNRQKALPKARSPAPSPHGSPIVYSRGRGDSLATPPAFNDVGTGSRIVSSPATSRPISGYISDGEGPSTGNKLRRSWLPGKSRHTSQDSTKGQSSTAWLVTEQQKIDYNLGPLTQGEKVPELWDEKGDTFVYLFPRTSDHGPSFKVPSVVLSSSQPLIGLVHGDIYAGRARAKSFDGRGSLSVDDATRNLVIRGPGTPPYTPSTNPMDSTSNSDGSTESIWSGGSDGPREVHLYLPINLSTDGSGGVPKSQSDIQTLVDARNLFAFLTCQPLVATRTCNSLFLVFVAIAKLLKQFEFTNLDNSTLGEPASASFNFYLDQMRLADVAHSREKTLEAIILGEQMRSTELYNEAFAHAAGRYLAIKEIKSPLFDQINHITRNRLERAALDLKSRQQSVNDRLTDFEFPSLFSGVAGSTARAEAKYVNWKAWKTSFFSFRKVFISYYKHLYGSWPPKASSKKNQFEESGLNRLVLKGLYRDLSSLYDLLANREALTTRHYDASDEEESNVDPLATALRVVLSEYDRSSPPVQPPIPFDVPRVPTMATVDPTFPFLAPKDQHKLSTHKLKSHETLLILAKSHNLDSDFKTPFLEMFKSFEEKEAKGKNAQELADQRYGHWLFMYAVLQALPMLVVDAPGLRFTQGVEYFLCEPPMGSAPWLEDSSNVKMAWYGVQGGAGVVSLPSDVVLYGVEGIYRRSHCWTVAEQWLSASESEAPLAPPAPLDSIGGFGDETFSPLEPPPGFAGGQLGSRPNSRGRDSVNSGARSSPGLSPHNYSDDERMSRSKHSHRSSIALGLEQLPIPAGGFGGASFGEELPPSMTPTGHGSRNSSPAKYGRRQQSVGRYSPARGEATPPATAGNTSGSTFDDILMNIGNDSKTSKKEKRKTIGL